MNGTDEVYVALLSWQQDHWTDRKIEQYRYSGHPKRKLLWNRFGENRRLDSRPKMIEKIAGIKDFLSLSGGTVPERETGLRIALNLQTYRECPSCSLCPGWPICPFERNAVAFFLLHIPDVCWRDQERRGLEAGWMRA